MEKEPWYMSRRVWGAVISAAVLTGVLLAPEQYDNWVALGSLVAGALGVTSWVKPKM